MNEIETEEFMAQMNNELKHIKERLQKMPTTAEMELANEKLVERVFEKCDRKYAVKLTEKIVYALCGAVLLAALGAIINLVIH